MPARHLMLTVVAVVSLVVATACGDSAEAPTAPAISPTVPGPAITPTDDVDSSPTTKQAASPAPNREGGYELIARWGDTAPLVLPVAIAALPDGSVAVADADGSRIVVFESDGTVETSWTSEGTWNLAAGPQGQLYALASRGGSLATVYDRDGTQLRQIEIPLDTTDGRVSVNGLMVADNGSVFIASGLEPGTGMSPAPFSGVVKLGAAGGELARWPAPDGLQPQHIVVSDDGMATVALIPQHSALTVPAPSQFPATIVRFNAESGPPEDWLDAEVSLSREIEIDALATMPDGSLLAVDAAGINRDDPDTTVLYTIDPASGAVDELGVLDDRQGAKLITVGLSVTGDGDIYLADALRHRVIHLNSAGEEVGEFGGVREGQLAVPQGAAIGSDGRLYVIDSATSRVVIFNRDGSLADEWDVPRNTSYAPGGVRDVTVGSDGRVIVTDSTPGQVTILSPEGEVVDQWTPPMHADVSSGQPIIFSPDQIALLDETLYATMRPEPIIASYSLDGEFVATWPADVTQPLGIGAHDNAVYALVAVRSQSDTASPATGEPVTEAQVQRLAGEDVEVVTSFEVGTIADDPSSFFPFHFAVAPDGSFFLADPFRRQIVKLDAEGTEVARWGLPPDASSNRDSWLSLAADETRLYVSDSALRQVLVYEATEQE